MASVAECWALIFISQNCSSSHRYTFEPGSCETLSQVLLAGGQLVFLGDLPFSPHLTINLAQNEWDNLDGPQNPNQKTNQRIGTALTACILYFSVIFIINGGRYQSPHPVLGWGSTTLPLADARIKTHAAAMASEVSAPILSIHFVRVD